MKYLAVVFALLMTFLSGCDSQNRENEEELIAPARDGIFVHVSTDDPHRVLMALSIAEKMSEDKDVLVFFDIDGINVVLEDAGDINYGTFESSKVLLTKLSERNVLIEACPMCLKSAGKSEADLMPGVNPAQKEDFFNFTNGRILTLDY